MSDAVVFAGGGLAGIAWELGVLAGIGDVAPAALMALRAPDVTYVGTSAGSGVAAQFASGRDLETSYALQLAAETAEFDPGVDVPGIIAQLGGILTSATDPTDARRRIGAWAVSASTPSQERRMVAITARLPEAVWPERRMLITAVDTETGERHVFDRDSGVSLRDAVAASSAVPGVWPPVPIDGRRYTDGGVSAVANADLAAGADRVLVLVPSLADAAPPLGMDPAELDALGDASVVVVYADAASIEAFGVNALDPVCRPAAARAGREVGRAEGVRIAEFLGV